MFIMKELSPHEFTNKNIISLRLLPQAAYQIKECMLFGNDAIKGYWRNVFLKKNAFVNGPIKRNVVKAQSVQTVCFNSIFSGNRHILQIQIF